MSDEETFLHEYLVRKKFSWNYIHYNVLNSSTTQYCVNHRKRIPPFDRSNTLVEDSSMLNISICMNTDKDILKICFLVTDISLRMMNKRVY